MGKVDRQRREEFQRYEMQKKFEEEEKKKSEHEISLELNAWPGRKESDALIYFFFFSEMNEEEKKKYENEHKALKEKHKKHKPVRIPFICLFLLRKNT